MATPMHEVANNPMGPIGPMGDTEALLSLEGLSQEDVELGRARTPRFWPERAYHAMNRTRAMLGLAVFALCVVLVPQVMRRNGWRLPGFRPAVLLGLDQEDNGCLPDEEMYAGICYMRCSILTSGKAPFRQGAAVCCKDDNILCMFGGQTQSEYLAIGGGQSPPNVPPHAPNIGGVCKGIVDDTEESFNGLCYPKCSTLTEGKFPIRVNPTACCGGSVLECKSGKGQVELSDAFGAGVHAPDKAMSEMDGKMDFDVQSAQCNTDEEEYLGVCFQKCSALTNGKASKRVGTESCCSCTPGMFESICCMWPLNVQSDMQYNTGISLKGKNTDPHPPGFAIRCSDGEEDVAGLCYIKCSEITKGKLPFRLSSTMCCETAIQSSDTCIDSPMMMRGGKKAAGLVHGPYIRPDPSAPGA